MRRIAVSASALLLCVSVVSAAAVKKYGKPLTLKEMTKVSDIYAKPDAFNGKRVKVQGPVVDVCSMQGCWIAIGSDKEFQSIRFKVEEGVIVFPMDSKGLTATVEGVVSVTVMSVADQIAAAQEMEKEKEAGKTAGKTVEKGKEKGAGMGAGMHAEMGGEMGKDKKPFDPKSIKGPKTVIMIKGEAAEIF